MSEKRKDDSAATESEPAKNARVSLVPSLPTTDDLQIQSAVCAESLPFKVHPSYGVQFSVYGPDGPDQLICHNDRRIVFTTYRAIFKVYRKAVGEYKFKVTHTTDDGDVLWFTGEAVDGKFRITGHGLELVLVREQRLAGPALLRRTSQKVHLCLFTGSLAALGRARPGAVFVRQEISSSGGPDKLFSDDAPFCFWVYRKAKEETACRVDLAHNGMVHVLIGTEEGDRFCIRGPDVKFELECYHLENKERSNEDPMYGRIVEAMTSRSQAAMRCIQEFGRGLHVMFPDSKCLSFQLNEGFEAVFTAKDREFTLKPAEFPSVNLQWSQEASREVGYTKICVSFASPGPLKGHGSVTGPVNVVLNAIRDMFLNT